MNKKYKFEDFYLLGCNSVPAVMKVDFLPYFKQLLDNNFAELEVFLMQRLEIKRFSNLTDEDIIAGAIATTPKDFKKKIKNKNYYMCNAQCLMKVIKQIFDQCLYDELSAKDVPYIAIHNYLHVLKVLLMDAEQLCNLYDNEIKGDTTYNSNIKIKRVHYMQIHQLLRQSLYGQVSKHSFADMETSSAILVIRQLIEIRMRRAFGVIAYLDEEGVVQPLDLSKIFDVLKRHKDDIQFPVKLENIERIYKWANLYTHSGQCDFCWLPHFVELILRPLTFGEKRDNTWSIKNGISIRKGVIEAIHNDLLKEKNIGRDTDEEFEVEGVKGGKRYSLLTCPIESEEK